MRDWILMIMTVNPSLDRMTELIDKRVEELALSPVGETLSKIESIVKLNDQKISLINLRVMYDGFIARLDGEEFNLIKEFAFGKHLREIAGGKSVSATYRKLAKALKKAEGVLRDLGVDAEQFEYYLQFPYISAKYSAIKRRAKRGEQQPTNGGVAPFNRPKKNSLPISKEFTEVILRDGACADRPFQTV